MLCVSACFAQNLYSCLRETEKAKLVSFINEAHEYSIDSDTIQASDLKSCSFNRLLKPGPGADIRTGVYLMRLPVDPSVGYFVLVDSSISILRTKNLNQEIGSIVSFARRIKVKATNEEWVRFLDFLYQEYEWRNPMIGAPLRR